MIILPNYVTSQIKRLAVVAEERRYTERLLLKWFATEGYIVDDTFQGPIADLIVKMQDPFEGCSPERTIERILQVMSQHSSP